MTLKFLHVEDSPTFQVEMADFLTKSGYSVRSVGTAEEGLVSVSADRPDVVVTDVVLPNMDGFKFVKALKRNDETKDIIVIILTAKDQETDKLWGMRQGANAYLVKGTNPTLDQAGFQATLADLLNSNGT